MKQMLALLGLTAFLQISPAFADGMEPLTPSDSRIKTVLYNESDIYTITTKYGYQTSIVFGANEEIQSISVGDRSMWQIIPSGNRIYLRPMQEGIDTNMAVLTSKHSYQFDIKSVSGNKGGNIYVARFTYPDTKGIIVPAPAHFSTTTTTTTVIAPPPPVASPVNAGPLYPNYRYTYAGPDDLSPLQVYDDGRSTFVKFRDASQPIPNFYIIDSSGREKLTSYTVKNGLVTIDAVAPEMVLRNSDGAVHLYNEMLNPG